MSTTTKIFVLSLAALSLTACLGTAEPEGNELDTSTTALPARSQNGMLPSVVTSARLVTDAVVRQALIGGSLSEQTLEQDPILSALAADAPSRTLIKTIASCALPSDVSFDVDLPAASGGTLHIAGGLGLASSWGASGGTCGADCQQWVSACVIARTNYTGTTVEISLRGDAPELAASAAEASSFPQREAAYGGNVFAYPQQLFACRGGSLISRVCGGDGSDTESCFVDVQGECSSVCGVEAPAPDAFFADCNFGGTRFDSVITVYRK